MDLPVDRPQSFLRSTHEARTLRNPHGRSTAERSAPPNLDDVAGELGLAEPDVGRVALARGGQFALDTLDDDRNGSMSSSPPVRRLPGDSIN